MIGDVAVVILAGGAGSRIGGGKPLRRLAGQRLIDRALRTARAWSDLIAVAVRDPAQVERVNAPVITDEPGIGGPLAGLVASLRFAERSERQFLLTIPADSPFLPSDLLDRLRSEIGDRSCALASSGGQIHPVCALWRTNALHRVPTYVAGGRRSLKGFAALVGVREVAWPNEPFDPFFNINSTDELAQAEGRAED
jgi:molybdopterin-guanine dinucleotide biosynthesis protein A